MTRRFAAGRVLLQQVEVEGRLRDLVADDGVISPAPHDDRPVDAVVSGGAVLPGLHDHHVHLLAWAAALSSVRCGPPEVRGPDDLRRVLITAPARPDGWLRGTGYHESVAGPLDRTRLDALVPDRPVRIQHRSGALWMLNSAALAVVAPTLDDSDDVERGPDGRPTGRLWRYDARLRAALPSDPPDLAAVGAALASYGVCGVTDATPELDPQAAALLSAAVQAGDLPGPVTVLGAETGAALPPGLRHGAAKLMLRDHDLPGYDDLRDLVATHHGAGRPVAVHCVSREALLLTGAVLDDLGSLPGDRIEHAALVPPGYATELARLGVRVVTQPAFLTDRGDDYLREVRPDDLECLYPFASLVAAGVPTAASSDAPYGDASPWRIMAAAHSRTTRAGAVITPEERVATSTTLAGYLGSADDPGGRPRVVGDGGSGWCLVDRPLTEALRSPADVRVTAVGWAPPSAG